MSLSVQELDSTVRTFYEGRGDVVREKFMTSFEIDQAHQILAKASPADLKPGTTPPSILFRKTIVFGPN